MKTEGSPVPTDGRELVIINPERDSFALVRV